MSKELTPLEALQELRQNNIDGSHLFDDELFDIIEHALKRLETLEEEKQSFDTRLEKKLKVLEIITNISKQTTHFRLIQRNMGNDNFNYYLAIDNCEYRLKDKEEYDILKEVLL